MNMEDQNSNNDYNNTLNITKISTPKKTITKKDHFTRRKHLFVYAKDF